MADRSKQSLVVYDKSGAKVATGDVGTKQVELTGLEGSKQVAAGDYQLAYTDGKNTSDKVDVPAFIVLAATVSVTGVKLSQNTVSMKIGDTKYITALVSPDKATDKRIICSSEDESIATFDSSGKVTAIGVGTTNITVTTVDGDFTDKCAVTVTNAE